MNATLPWIVLSLVGGGLTLMGFKRSQADAVAATLLDEEAYQPHGGGGKTRALSVDAARRRAWIVGGALFGLGLLILIEDFRLRFCSLPRWAQQRASSTIEERRRSFKSSQGRDLSSSSPLRWSGL